MKPDKETQIIDGGICDGCGQWAQFLEVVNCAPVVNACICRSCLERNVAVAMRPLNVTEEENNYLWHLVDDHKMTTTGDEPDALVLCSLRHKLGELRETQWPNDGTQRGRDAEATNATETRTRPSLK